jgi:hypothetical protein
MSAHEIAKRNDDGAERRADPDLAALLKATADTMAAVNAAAARLDDELTALRSQPRRGMARSRS